MDIFIQWLAANSLKGAILIVTVFLVQFVFSKQIPQKWKYLMWMLVVVRLVMPAVFESDSSIFNLQKIWQTETVNHVESNIIPQDHSATIDTSQQTEPISVIAPANEIKLSSVMFFVWTAVASLLFSYLLWKNFSLLNLVRKERTVIENRWLRLLEDCKRELKLYTPVQVVETVHVNTPALMGFLRPRILLPKGMLSKMTEGEIRLIFMHELTHLKCGDIIINWIISLIQIIHWFNPFVWFAFAKAREARELACDDRILSFLGKDYSKKYGLTIIRLLDLYCNENKITGMVGILENKKQIKRRIEMIRNPNPKNKGALIFTLLLLTFTGVVFLSEAKEKTKPAITRKTTNPDIENGPDWFKKLNRIIIPSFNFEDVSVKTAVKYLNEESKRLDPEKKGVDISITNPKLDKTPISVSGKNISLMKAVELVCNAAGVGTKLSGNKDGVTITLSEEKAHSNYTAMYRKLKSIIIPSINLEKTKLPDAIKFLEKLAKQYDPEHKGVNIVLNLDKTQTANPPMTTFKSDYSSLFDVMHGICKSAGLHYYVTTTNGKVIITSYLPEKPSSVQQKLKSIIIPSFRFEDIPLEVSIPYLQKQVKLFDPEKRGVNILIVDPKLAKTPINVSGRKISLEKALGLICKEANAQYIISQKGIITIDIANQTR